MTLPVCRYRMFCVAVLLQLLVVTMAHAYSSADQMADELQINLLDSDGLSQWVNDMRLARESDRDLVAWMDLMCRTELVHAITTLESRQPLRAWLDLMTDARVLYTMMDEGSAAIFDPWLQRMVDPMLIATILYSEDVDLMNAWSGALGNQRYMRSMMEVMSPGTMEETVQSMMTSMDAMMEALGAGNESLSNTNAN